MFNNEEISKVLEDEQVLAKYKEFCVLAYKNPDRIPSPLNIKVWVLNIALGESGGFPLKDLVIGVIEAAIYTYSHSLEYHIKLAEETSLQRMEEKGLSNELVEKVKNNNKAIYALLHKMKDNGLSLEQEFNIESFNKQVDNMSLEQSKSILKDFYKMAFIREKQYQKFIKEHLLKV